MTNVYQWKVVNSTFKGTSDHLDHVQVLVTAKDPQWKAVDKDAVQPVGTFLGEVELPAVKDGQVVIPVNEIDQATLLQWVKAELGPDNIDIWQKEAEANYKVTVNPPATFCPSK